MRPSAGSDALSSGRPRSRKSSVADHAVHGESSSHAPTTFFMRSEAELEHSLVDSQATEPSNRQRDSTFGVQSLEDALETAFGKDKVAENVLGTPTPAAQQHARRTSRGSVPKSPKQPNSPRTAPVQNHKRKVSSASSTVSPTQLSAGGQSPMLPPAIPSTPKSSSVHSLRLSDEESNTDDVASQTFTSGGEDEGAHTEQAASGSFPQLVMPSIQMPARRPFTIRGKAMGKLKVLIAGETGTGKTALIRSIVQSCKDIVHVDPLSPSQSFAQSSPPPKSKSRKRKVANVGTTRITEIHASTKPLPHWWTDLDESRVQRKRKGSTDNVLERNLCFIDTPGFGKGASNVEDMGLVIDYVEFLLYQTAAVTSLDDNDLLGVVSGRGGVHIDVVLYVLAPDHDISKDIEFMQRLSILTNVIPIIAKSDTVSPSDIVTIKTSILARMQAAAIRPFLFGDALDDAILAVQGLQSFTSTGSSPCEGSSLEAKQYPFQISTHPYAISSTPGPDNDTMDASLLMSPDYIQPLYPSELATLIDQLFDPESISWLRHAAAKKFLAWRHRTKLPANPLITHSILQPRHHQGSLSSSSVGLHGGALNTSTTSSIFSAASPSGVLVPRAASPFYLSNSQFNSNLQSPFQGSSPSLSHSPAEGLEGPTDFSLARYHNYAQSDPRLADIRVAKWATDLHKSLRNERERYEELQRNERAKWLLERVSEEVRDGNIVTSPPTSPRAEWAIVRHKSKKETTGLFRRYTKPIGRDSRDPLGLCDFGDEVRRRGFVLVKVLGGMSVIGAVVMAVVKACGVDTGSPEGGIWSWLTGGAAE